MKKSELRQLVREELGKHVPLSDQIYEALSKIQEFNQLGMDQQGEICMKVEKLILRNY